MATNIANGLTIPGANYFLDLVHGRVSAVNTIYLSILYGDTSVTGDGYPEEITGQGFNEALHATTNYDRVAVVRDTVFGAGSGGISQNLSTILFGTADGRWTDVSPNKAIALGIHHAAIGQAGADICYGVIKLSVQQEYVTGNTVSFPAGSLSLQLVATERVTV